MRVYLRKSQCWKVTDEAGKKVYTPAPNEPPPHVTARAKHVYNLPDDVAQALLDCREAFPLDAKGEPDTSYEPKPAAPKPKPRPKPAATATKKPPKG